MYKKLNNSIVSPVLVVDQQYCGSYQEIFGDMSSYEYFQYLHLGIISLSPESPFRKSLMTSLNSQPFLSLNSSEVQNFKSTKAQLDCSVHSQWDCSGSWKSVLKNFRLLIEPTLLLGSVLPWL